MTANSPQSQCVSSGTVAGGVQFHIIANFSPPVIGFGVDSVDILEQTDVHEPFHYHSDSAISGDTYSSPPYSVCSSPPTGYQTWVVCNLNVPLTTFSFHNTNYVITANYHYIRANPGAYPPSPSNPMYSRVDGSLSITVKFDNLIVQSEPKILKWDPDDESIRDTTFSYTLSSAQKKNCQVTIDIYNLDAVYDNNGDPNPVFETTLNQLCPGTYTFTWDGTTNKVGMPSPATAPRGLYTFDVKVQGACPYDGDRMRSSALKISDHEVNGAPPNNFEARYLLSDTKPAYAAGVKVFGLTDDKGWTQVWEDTSGGTALSPTWNEVLVPGSVIDLLEEWRVVFWAIDDHIELDKAHRRKPALEVNKNPCIGTAIDIGIKGKLSDISGGTFDVDMSTAAEYAARSQDWVYFPKKEATLNWVSVPVEWYYDRIFPWLSREAGPMWLVKATPPQNSSGAKVIGAGYYIGVLPRGSSKPKKKQINTPYIDVYYALGRVNIFYLATHMKDWYGSEVWLGKGTYLTASNVNQLPFELSHIRCVLLLHCTDFALTSPEEEISQSLLQAFYQKKAQFVAGIVGGPLPQLKAKEFSQVFWTLATKGTYYNGEYYFCPLYTAVWVAFAYAYYKRGTETPSGGNEAIPRPFYRGTNGLLYIPPQ